MPGSDLSIVVVEDSRLFLDLLVETLKLRWSDVLGFQKPDVAELVIRANPPDVLLLDFRMSVSGADMFRRLCRFCPNTGIGFVTGVSRGEIVKAIPCRQFGYLQKPCTIDCIHQLCLDLSSPDRSQSLCRNEQNGC